ncbi:MAG: hypothetical protein JO271_10760 [Verrucomicrobia bacterium]|nr:hypothetical protein [Verrucomicrobiota bacterium]MBV9274107.1 hypothetical protein [Verrucomicrobiota bacterium]
MDTTIGETILAVLSSPVGESIAMLLSVVAQDVMFSRDVKNVAYSYPLSI